MFKDATSATSGTLTALPGRTYCFSVRARDDAGNVSAYGPQSCIGYPVDERTMSAAGAWTKLSSSVYYYSTALTSTTASATLKLPATYRRLYLVATTCSGCGTVNVYFGSTLLKSVSLNASATTNRVIFSIDVSSTVKSGTVTLRQSSAGKKVTIDGLGIYLG
jgi:hypothetical protein